MLVEETFPDYDPSIVAQYGEGYSNISGIEFFGSPFYDTGPKWFPFGK